MPAISAIYGIHPWEIELLTSAEVEEYLSELPRRTPREE